MINQHLRFALLASLTFTAFTTLAQQSEAQLLNKLRGDYGGNSQIQYSPDDPSTRSRLFNLQTGHAGAFYNCDGEEDKRNSPYICWKNGPCGEKFHCALLDVLDWRRDRNEIAQRICDGAGACCSGGKCGSPQSTVIATQKPCECAECLAANSVSAETATAAKSQKRESSIQQAFASLKKKAKVSTKTNAVGLIVNNTPSVIEQPSPQEQSKPCNCASCKAKRATPETQDPSVVAKESSEATIATSRSASLLDRARSSRKQR